MNQSIREGWQVFSEGSGWLCSHWSLGPPETGSWGSERSLSGSFGPAPRQMYCGLISRKGSKGEASLLGHTWSRSPWAGGSWGRFLSPDWQFLWSQGSFRRSPLPGEIVWPETIISPSKADLPVCPLCLFSLTCDRLHHVQQENVKGRTANKFIATASCSGINLFHEWLLSIHCRQSPRRWSGLSACGRLLLA